MWRQTEYFGVKETSPLTEKERIPNDLEFDKDAVERIA